MSGGENGRGLVRAPLWSGIWWLQGMALNQQCDNDGRYHHHKHHSLPSLPQFEIQEQAMFAKCIFRKKNCLAQKSFFRKPKKANGEPWICPPLKLLAFYPQVCGSAQKNAKLRISKEKANPQEQTLPTKSLLITSCDAQMLKAEKCRT